MSTQSNGWRLPNALIILLSILSMVLGLGGLQFMQVGRFIAEIINPPIELSERLLTTANMLPLFKTKAHGDEMFDAEFYEETSFTRWGITTSTKTTAYFGVLTFGNHALLVKTDSPISESLVDYEGQLTSIRSDNVAFEIYNKYLTEAPELKDVFMPLLLDTTSAPTEWAAVYILLAVLVLIGLGGFVTAWLRLNPADRSL